jgi:hypothetical protein
MFEFLPGRGTWVGSVGVGARDLRVVEDVVARVLLRSGPELHHSRWRNLGGVQLMVTEIVRRVGRIEVAGPLTRAGSNAYAGQVDLPAQAGKR